MIKGERGAVFAVGLVVGVAIALFFFVWAFPWFSDPSSDATYCQSTGTHCEELYENNKDPHYWVRPFHGWLFAEDSLAQWLMALFTIAATGVSLFAVILVNDTLRENRRATDQSRRSADASVISAQASQQANTIAQRDFILRHKPLLQADMFGPYIDEGKYPLGSFAEGEPERYTQFEVGVEITNVSDSVALIYRSRVFALDIRDIGVSSPPHRDVFGYLGSDDVYWPCWPMGRFYKRDNPPSDIIMGNVGSISLNHDRREGLIMDGYPPIVGQIFYRDQTGRGWVHGFAFRPLNYWIGDSFSRWGGEEYNYTRESGE